MVISDVDLRAIGMTAALNGGASLRCMSKTLRFTLVISSLGPGGAERVMAIMANYWAEHAREVTLITLASRTHDFYPLHHGVHRIALGVTGISSHVVSAVWNNLRRLQRLRQEIRASQPDVVLSFIDQANVLTLAGSLGLGIPVVVSERIDPRYHDIGFIWAWLRRLLYSQADALVVQTDGVRGWAERIVKSQAVHVIPNAAPGSVVRHNDGLDLKPTGRTIVAMGRFALQKGFDILLKAFARCARKHSDWFLVILGDGEERGRLEALAVELGVKDRVNMPGQVKDPFGILCGADLFILSSRYEGFPNALMEAMACGLAVISTDCPSGPREIIRDGIDGVLVQPGDVDSLVAAMDRLMADQAARQRLGKRAIEVAERFSTEKVMKMWDELFFSLSIGPILAESDSFMQQAEDRQTERRL
jgi:glycosyltransferase involved in cell wall biosynthesis